MFKNYKKVIIVFSLFLSMTTIAWFCFFSYGTSRLETRIAIFMENIKQKGYLLSYSTLKFSGNPFSIQVVMDNPYFKDPQGLVEWKGQGIKITTRPWDFYTLHLSLPGDQKLVVPQYDALSFGNLHLKDASGVVQLNSKGLLESVAFTVPLLSSIRENKPQLLALRNLSFQVSNIIDPLNLKLSLTTQLEGMEKFFNKSPNNRPFTVNFVADLSGFKPVFSFPKSLAEWRDGGGVLEIRLLKIDWPPIRAELEGTLTLDEGMYPLGSFSSRISGYKKALNDMVELGWIKKKKVILAQLMLDIFAFTDEKGVKTIKAPITLQNKVLSVGPASLIKLKPLDKN